MHTLADVVAYAAKGLTMRLGLVSPGSCDDKLRWLASLASGDLAVAATFDLSYRDLPTSRQRLFRRLGLHPGADLDASAAAALDDTSLDAARRGLEDLLEHNLISEPHRGRFRLHDLIAEHARTLTAADTPAEQDTALDRLTGFYLHTATTAARYLARRTPTC